MVLELSDYTKSILAQDGDFVEQRDIELSAKAVLQHPSLQTEEAQEKSQKYKEAGKIEGTVEWYGEQLYKIVRTYMRLLELDSLGLQIPSDDLKTMREVCITSLNLLKNEEETLVAVQPFCANGCSSREMLSFCYVRAEFMMTGAEGLHRSGSSPTTN